MIAGTGISIHSSHGPGRFLEVAVRLPTRNRELAAEMTCRLGAFHPLSEQTVRGV